MTIGGDGARDHRSGCRRPARPRSRRARFGDGGHDVGVARQDRPRSAPSTRVAVAGLLIAIDNEAWGYAAVLAVTLVALNVVYLPRRYVPMKYLLPGLFFLAVFALYPVLYTVYASTTNYGTGHVLSKDQAIEQIQSQSVQPGRGRHAPTTSRRCAATTDVRRLTACSTPRPSELFLGTTERARAELDADDAELRSLTTTGRTFVESGRRPHRRARRGRRHAARATPPTPDAYVMPGETEDAAIHDLGRPGLRDPTTRVYDADADTITDTDGSGRRVHRDRRAVHLARRQTR